MSYRGRASYNRAPNCASRNTKPYIVTTASKVFFVKYIQILYLLTDKSDLWLVAQTSFNISRTSALVPGKSL